MRTGRLMLCFALATTGCERQPAPADEPEDAAAEVELPALPLPEHLDQDVDAYIAQWGHGWPTFRFHGEIGISVRGELLLQRAYGYRDLAAQDRHPGDAAFRTGTLSAHVTIATALALVREGTLALEEPVNRFVPEQRVPASITVEHLLTHSSGLPSFTQDIAFSHIKHIARTHEQIARGFTGDPLEFEPGTDFAPSNSNSALLGLVIERATGQPYEEVARTRVLAPLAMTHTRWGATAGETVGLVFDEAEHLEPPERVDPLAFGASGGWTSTTRDLHRLYAGLGMQRFGGELAQLRWFGANPIELPYAFVESTIEGHTAYLWLGLIDGFNSAVLVVPDDELVVTVLGNSEVVPAQHVVGDVMRLAYGLPVPERIEPRAIPMPPAELARAADEWIVTRVSEELLLESVDPETFDMLRRIRTEHATDTGTLTLLIPEHGRKRMHPRSPGRWFFMDGPQSTARLERAPTSDKDVLVLEREGTALRYVRAPRDLLATRE